MRTARRIARWTRLVLASLYLVGILVQFVLAGYGWWVGSFEAHTELGWTIMHLLPLLILIAGLLAWRPFSEIALTVAVGLFGIIQPVLAAAGSWPAAFHPLNALVLFFLTHLLVRRDRRTLRHAGVRAPGETRAEPAPLS